MIRTTIQDEKTFGEFFKDFNFEEFAFDTETTGLNHRKNEIIGISMCDGKKACYIPIRHKSRQQLKPGYVMCNIGEKIDTKCKKLIGHNLKFDIHFMRNELKWSVLQKPEYADTMVMHHLLDENTPHGLKPLAQKFLGADPHLFDNFLKTYEDGSFVPIEDMAPYAMDDAEWTWHLYKRFSKGIKAQGLERYFKEVEMPFLKVLIEIEQRGIKIDKDLLFEYDRTVRDRINKLSVLIHEAVPQKTVQIDLFGNITNGFNIDSASELGKILFQDMKIKPIKKTPTGKPSCDMEQFQLLLQKRISKEDFDLWKDGKLEVKDIFSYLTEYKKLRKLFTAYIMAYEKKLEGDRIYPSMIQHKIVTGRLASWNPNIMQLPRPKTYKIDGEYIEFRRLFLPDKGFKMIAGDFSNEEIRVAASLAEDKGMMDALIKGQDFHLSTANMVFNLGLSDDELIKGNPGFKEAVAKFKKPRQEAKAINFGILFGKTEKSFATDLGISNDEAKDLMDSYFKAFPGLKVAIDKTHDQVKKQGYVVELFGRRRRFEKLEEGYYPNEAYRMSFNFKVQGSSATILKLVCNRLRKELPEAVMMFTVHDEIVFQVKENAEEVRDKIKDIMENTVKLPVPLPVDLEIGKNYEQVK